MALTHPPHILIIGASRGIGLELTRQYLADGALVTATARDDAGLQRLRELGARALKLDVTSAPSVAGLAWQLDGSQFTTVVVNAGVYGPKLRTLDAPTDTDFDQVMHTNVLGPMRVVPQLLDALAPQAKLAVISSRMGSIGSRTVTDGWLYRASKAALNSVLKDLSLALTDRATCVALHPGWVRTDMGGPDADLPVETSARMLRATLAGLGTADTGQFFDHDGTPIPW